jgi:DNA (cytosine-5)-methyltransferase 3A
MNVLSLFDGMSCGQIALNRAEIKYDNYYASEIDKHAIKVTQHHFPNTKHLGSVTDIKAEDLPPIDLLIGGSPCQSFSSSGKRTGFDGKSGLFWEYARLLKELKPKYFLLENVKMKKEWEKIISRELSVEPIELNSSIVSAQNRVRLYWTNIPFNIPEDRGVNLIDILEDVEMVGPGAIRGRNVNKATIVGRRINGSGHREDGNKKIPITQCLEVRKANRNKSNCLTTVMKDNVLTSLPIGRHIDPYKNDLPFRYYTLNEYCRLQTVDDGYFDNIVSESQAKKMLGNGWTVDIIVELLKGIKYNIKTKKQRTLF